MVLLTRGGGSDDARDVVSRAFASDGGALKTAQVDIRLGLTGSAAADGEPALIELSGPYQAGDAKSAGFRFGIAVNGSGEQPLATLTGVGGRSYVSVGDQHWVLAADALDDLKADDRKDEGLTLASLGIDPESWLRDPEVVGEEQWDGQPATHVRAQVDVPRMLDDLKKVTGRAGRSDSDEAKAAAEALDGIGDDVSAATMDVWVGDGDGALRRLQVDVQLEDGRLALDVGLTKVNEPVRISAPKNARPFDELLSVLSAVTQQGGQAGDGGTTTSPAPPAGTTTSESAPSGGGDPYAACVERAAGDVAKLQACADLQD